MQTHALFCKGFVILRFLHRGGVEFAETAQRKGQSPRNLRVLCASAVRELKLRPKRLRQVLCAWRRSLRQGQRLLDTRVWWK
jgi:hypothetical protein